MVTATAGVQHPHAKSWRLPILFGAGCFVLAIVSIMRGHQHHDVHQEAISAREFHRDAFLNSGFSVKGTLSRMRDLEESAVHAISDKLHHMSDSLHSAHENPILDSPVHSSDSGQVPQKQVLDILPPVPAVLIEDGSPDGSGSDGGDGALEEEGEGELQSSDAGTEGEGDEGEESQEGEGEEDHETDLAGLIDPADMDHLLNATLKGEDHSFAAALNQTVAKVGSRRRGATHTTRSKPRTSRAHAEDKTKSDMGVWEQQHAALAARIRTARERHGSHPSTVRVAASGSSHHSPRTDKAAEIEAGGLSSPRGVTIESARGDEPASPMALSPKDQKQKYRRTKHCGGMCILHQLDRKKGKHGDADWVTEDDGSFQEDGDPAVDDRSSCRGQCGAHGFCRDGKCICTVFYEGDHCDQPREVTGLRTKFEGSFMFNSERLRNHVGKYLKYTCNPKKGTSETHTVRVRITDALIEVLPKADPMKGRIYEKCAVVGNSGVLGYHEYGPTIDSHNAVFRFNVGPTTGFESQVGSRTTFRLVNTNHAGWHEKNEADIQQLQSMIGLLLYVKYRRHHPNAKLFAFDPDFSSFVSSNLRVLPTGGYFAIWMALHRCTQVSVYGFHFEPGFGIRHHYFNREQPLKGGNAIHDYDAEYRKIKYMAKNKLLTLVEPCIAGCPEETGIPSILPNGAACQCGTGNPMPVAKEGYCRVQDSFTCFLKCPYPLKCISQEGAGAAANRAEGACVSPMMKMYQDGELRCEPMLAS